MTAFLVVAATLVGLAVGSFLNVVIHRVPRKESVVRPRSACPSCHTTIANRDNIPVVSWLVLGGRCRTCGARISPRYLAVELLTGSLFAATALRFGYSWSLPAFLVLVAGLIALAFTDLEHFLLPVRIVYPLAGLLAVLLLVATLATGNWSRLGTAVLCAVIPFVVFFALHSANPSWMGFGDVRLAPVLGLALGWLGASTALLGFFVSFLLGAVIGVALTLARKVELKAPVPFGVFLAAGTLIAVFFGEPLLRLYRRT